MPKFDVTAPDGRVFEVNGPAGATQNDAIDYVRQNFYNQPSAAKEMGPDIVIGDIHGTASTPAKPQGSAERPANSESKSILGSLGAGLGYGVGQTALGIQQLAGHGLQKIGGVVKPDQTLTSLITGVRPKNIVERAGEWLTNDANTGLANLKSQYQPYEDSNPKTAIAGNIGGSIAATIPLTIAAPASVPATLTGLAGRGAISGALSAAAAPVSNDSVENQDYFSEKAKQAALGGALGGASAPIFGAIGKAISPKVSTDVKDLMAMGVTPTPGQILGGGAARTEEKMTSLPIVGGMIKNAQRRSLEDFNRAAYNKVLEPIGQTYTGKVGQDAVRDVRAAIGGAYDDILPKMQMKVDSQFQSEVSKIGQMAQGLPEAQQKTFMNVLKTQIFGKLGPQGTMDGVDLKGVQSELSKATSGYLGDASFDNRQLGAALSALKDAVEGNLVRVNPPELSQQLASANKAWANFVRLRSAAASLGAANNDGVFTAAQLQNAVKAADKSVGKGAFATGGALMQDLSSKGQNVLGSKYPDSGTAGRLGPLVIPAAVAAPFTAAATIGGLGLGALPYTKAGQKLAAGLLTSRPDFAEPIGNLVRRGGLLTVPAVTPLLGD